MIAYIKKAILQIYRWIVQHERATVGLVAIVAAGIFGFVKLADEVSEGDSKNIDEQILLAMREPDDLADPIGPDWIEEMARDITALGSVVVLGIVTSVTVGYLWLTKQHWVALFVMAAIVSGMLISIGLKTTFDRPRPDLVPHATHVYTKSFPSGHSAMSAMVFLTLGALVARVQRLPRTRIYFLMVAVFLTTIVGLSRIYLGVHWPTDVIAGWMFGATWAALAWLVFRWIAGLTNDE